jgi:hypothetical protein
MLAPATSGALGLTSQSEASLMSFWAPPSAYPPASPRTQWLYVGLQTEPPENRNIRNCCRRLSGIFGLKFRKWEDGDFLKITEARCWRVLSAVEKIFPQTAECLAGAAGIEPPNGGIKIRQSPLILIAFLPPCCICVAFRTSGLCRDDPIGSGNSEKRI